MPNTQNRSALGRLAELALAVPALLFMPFWEAGKFLSKKAYGGSFWRGLLAGLAGLPAAAYGGFTAANVVGWHYHWSWPFWTLAGALGFLLVEFIVWPSLYLVIFKPLWDLSDKIFKVNRKVAENVVRPVCATAIDIVRHLPFSEHLWSVSEGKTKTGRKWGIKALGAVLMLGALGAGLSAGYFVYHAVVGLLPVFGALPAFTGVFLSQVVAAVLAVTSLVFVTGFIGQYIEYGSDKEGRENSTAVAYSAIATFFAVTKLAIFSGLSLAMAVPAAALVFVVALAYVLPAFLALLQGGLMDALLKGWKNLLTSAYEDEKDAAYALFFAQLTNILVALAEGVVAYLVAGAVHLPEVVTYVLTAGVAIYSYASTAKELGTSKHVSPIFGLTLSAAVGILAYIYAPATLAAHGFYHYGFGIITALGTGLVAYPFAYLALRFCAKPIAPAVGPALAGLNGKATAVYKTVKDQVRKLQKAAFDDSTPYSGMFGHLFLLSVIGAAVWNDAMSLVPALHFSFWVNTAIIAVVATNVYMLLAKLSSRYGAETFSFGVGCAALMGAGHWALGLSGGSWWTAAVVGLTAASVAGGLVAPAIYLIIRPVANAILTPWLAPLMKTVFDGLWAVYVAFWNKFTIVFKFLRAIFGPAIALAVSVWNGMRAVYKRILGGK